MSACEKPDYPPKERPTLKATISSDGRLIAVLDRGGVGRPRLRIKWLDRNEPWRELPVPMYTNSIRFGLDGYGLLMTHRIENDMSMAQLVRWDLNDINKEVQLIYRGPRLVFPIEVRPGQILVRSCQQEVTSGASRCDRGVGVVWLLLESNGRVVPVTPPGAPVVYSQPNVTSKGFFWLSDFDSTKMKSVDQSLLLISYPFPGGESPKFDVERLSLDPDIDCDFNLERCLWGFKSGLHPETGEYQFNTKIIFKSLTCQPDGLQGYADERAVTPDGRFGVMSVAERYDLPRHVVFMEFQAGHCEPVSIQHLDFEE
jgi:hypothetical protein